MGGFLRIPGLVDYKLLNSSSQRVCAFLSLASNLCKAACFVSSFAPKSPFLRMVSASFAAAAKQLSTSLPTRQGDFLVLLKKLIDGYAIVSSFSWVPRYQDADYRFF